MSQISMARRKRMAALRQDLKDLLESHAHANQGMMSVAEVVSVLSGAAIDMLNWSMQSEDDDEAEGAGEAP